LTDPGEVRVGEADVRVDAVQQSGPWMVGFDPLPVGVSDFVVEPGEWAPAGPLGEEPGLPVQPWLGLGAAQPVAPVE
jgi:hypothetical protein